MVMAFRLAEASAQAPAAEPPGTELSADLTKLSISEAAALVRKKKVSPVELTRASLAQIEQLNPSLNAFVTVTAESALAQAREAEAEVQRGKLRGPLHGIPIGLKDLFDTPASGQRLAAPCSRTEFPHKMPKWYGGSKRLVRCFLASTTCTNSPTAGPRSSVTLAPCTTPGG